MCLGSYCDINVYSYFKETTLRTFQYSVASTSKNFIVIILQGADPILPIKKKTRLKFVILTVSRSFHHCIVILMMEILGFFALHTSIGHNWYLGSFIIWVIWENINVPIPLVNIFLNNTCYNHLLNVYVSWRFLHVCFNMLLKTGKK